MPKPFLSILFLTLFSWSTAVAQDTTGYLKQSPEQSTLTAVRKFRDSLNSLPHNPAFDSLIATVTTVLNITKTISDLHTIYFVGRYFTESSEALNMVAGVRNKAQVCRYINKDLSLKVAAANDTSFGLETTMFFGKESTIQVNIMINGVTPRQGVYRLYWAPYRSIPLNQMIKSNNFDGNSNTLSNPYEASVVLPGYFIFWIRDANNSDYYKPDFPYKVIENKDKPITINFTKLNG